MWVSRLDLMFQFCMYILYNNASCADRIIALWTTDLVAQLLPDHCSDNIICSYIYSKYAKLDVATCSNHPMTIVNG